MMTNNWFYYATALVLIVAVAFIIKKVTSCMVKAIAFLILLAILMGGDFYVQYFS